MDDRANGKRVTAAITLLDKSCALLDAAGKYLASASIGDALDLLRRPRELPAQLDDSDS